MQIPQYVRVRGARWRVLDVRAYEDCELVTLTGVCAAVHRRRATLPRAVRRHRAYRPAEPATGGSSGALAQRLSTSPRRQSAARRTGGCAPRTDRSAAAPARTGAGDSSRVGVARPARGRGRSRQDDSGGTRLRRTARPWRDRSRSRAHARRAARPVARRALEAFFDSRDDRRCAGAAHGGRDPAGRAQSMVDPADRDRVNRLRQAPGGAAGGRGVLVGPGHRGRSARGRRRRLRSTRRRQHARRPSGLCAPADGDAALRRPPCLRVPLRTRIARRGSSSGLQA